MTLNRDRVVAASLVGTVVVVLGFASGLGRVPVGAADQQAITHPPQSPDHVTGTTPPPSAYTGQPQAQSQPNRNVVANPDPTHPNQVHPDPTHPGGHPNPAPTPPTTTPPTTKPPAQQPPCDVDAIGALLGQLGALVEGLPLVSDLTGALPLLSGDGLAGVTGVLGGLTGTAGGLTGGLLGGATPTSLTGPLAGVLPTGATGLVPGSAVGGVGGLPDLAGVVGTPTSTGALPIAGTDNAQLNGLLGDRCGLLVRPGDGAIVGLLSTP